jgi:hypothetical protein
LARLYAGVTEAEIIDAVKASELSQSEAGRRLAGHGVMSRTASIPSSGGTSDWRV